MFLLRIIPPYRRQFLKIHLHPIVSSHLLVIRYSPYMTSKIHQEHNQPFQTHLNK